MAEIHHGCCVGADHEFHVAVIRNGIGSGEYTHGPVHAHPCTIEAMVDRGSLELADEVHPAKPPLDRNRDIVDACDVLLACPKGPEEQRSGTWATVRYARKQGKRVVIFWPDGRVDDSTAAPRPTPGGKGE